MHRALCIYVKNFKDALEVAAEEEKGEREEKENNKKTMRLLRTLPWPKDHKSICDMDFSFFQKLLLNLICNMAGCMFLSLRHRHLIW